jgi:hypothetical protein
MIPSVMATLHSDDAHRCVKIIKGSDGTFGYQEFRRDPEDAGGWTLVRENPPGSYATQVQAVAAAKDEVAWLGVMAASAKEAQ